MADPTISYERSIEAAGIALASGDQAGAERALREAIEAIDGVDDYRLDLAAVLARLGGLKQETGNLAEAETYFQRALEIGERELGPENLGIVPALKGLGTTRLVQGNPAIAEPLLTRALAISERHLGEDHPDLVILLNDLTRLYLKQMAHGFAEPLLLRLLELKRSKGDEHPEVATVLASLATVRQALGRHESAEQLWRRVLAIRERTLAPNHFAVATALEHLAETCAARGKLGEALGLSQRALTIREATLGRDHSSLRVSRERIADLELQASEDTFDVSGLRPPPAVSERSPGSAQPGSALVPLGERPNAAVSPALPRPTLERSANARPLDRILAPTEGGLVMTPVKQAGTYLDVLQDIQQEMESADADQPAFPGAKEGVVGAVTAFVQRRRVATITGAAAVILLPFAVWGVASSSRSGQPEFVVNDAATVQTQAAPTAAGALAADVLIGAGDSAAKAAAAKFERGDAVGSDDAVLTTLRAPTVSIRIDSVRGLAGVSPLATNSESVLKHLASSATLNRTTATIGAPVRARPIGQLPTPKYPAQQLRQRTSGEVRVRFDVDTSGRPVMSTFNVLSTPHPQLANAVKDVIPGIRFQPARTPWPENKAIVETVELSFYFALPATKEEDSQ